MKAVQVAKTYVTNNHIEISDASFVSEVMYKNIYNEYEPAYWSVKWHIVPRVKGRYFEIKIYNNGKIKPQYGK